MISPARAICNTPPGVSWFQEESACSTMAILSDDHCAFANCTNSNNSGHTIYRIFLLLFMYTCNYSINGEYHKKSQHHHRQHTDLRPNGVNLGLGFRPSPP